MRVSKDDAVASVSANISHTETLTESFPRGSGVMDAIRRKCLDCTVGMRAEIENCPCSDSCALWPYRMGRNPLHGRAAE